MQPKKGHASHDGGPPSRPQSWMNLSDKRDALLLQFIHTELDLADTFCQLAVTSSTVPRTTRNISNATQAYDAVVHFFDEAAMQPEARREISSRLEHLEDQIRSLNRWQSEEYPGSPEPAPHKED